MTIAAVSGSNDHEFTIAFPTQSAAGTYTVKVGPDLQDWYGNDMNQNRNSVNGETSDAFVETIRQTASGSADLLSVTGLPATITAGTSATITVTALSSSGGTDTNFLGTIAFSSSDSQAVLPASYPFTASNAGTHTFTVTFKTAGPQSITATNTSNSAIIGTEDNIIVQAAAAKSLNVTGFPTTDIAGTTQTFSVTAYDAYGNVATGYLGTVAFTSSDAKAILPANYLMIPEDQGVFAFTATLETAGTQSITATDTSTSTITSTESNIVVQAAALNSLVVTGFPASDTAGAAGSLTVTAYDIYGNLATNYTGTVSLTSSDLRAVLPASYPFTAADAGKHTFPVTLETSGTQSITATDSKSGVKNTESNIVVQAAAAKTLTIMGLPATVTAGTAYTIAVTAYDAYGNVATGYTGTVAFSSTDPNALLPSSYPFVSSNAGAHSFSVTFETTGTRSITATDTTTASITGTASGIAVQAIAAKTLTITGLPATVTAGTAYTIAVTAYDAYGNVATGYAGTVAFSSTDPNALLPSSYPFVSSNAGTHTFSVTFETTGTRSITATDTTTASITGSASTTVNVSVSAALISRDTTTEGNWIGTYGTQGYDIIGNAASLPSYATVTPSGQSSYTWGATTDPRGLQDAGGTGRIAACWYSGTSFTVDVNLTDGQTHDLELYFVDWDTTGRGEQVQISSVSSGVVLDTETISSFHSGLYLDYQVSGNLLIKFTRTSGANALLSGLFIDPPSTPTPTPTPTPTSTATAALISRDTTTEGNWIGTYGTQGYDIIGNAASLPSYATVTPSGQSSYTWGATTDPRGLQDAGGTGRIAACWYSGTSFTVDVNLTDGQTHDLELYFVDWDSTGRGEQVQISSASSGVVLDTETISSFHSGLYLDYQVSGNLLIKFTRTSGANALLSGLFLDPANGSAGASAPPININTDTTTEGNGIGTYGTQGYDAVIAVSVPSYDTMAPSGTSAYTWVASTAAPRILQGGRKTGSLATGESLLASPGA